MISYLRNYGIRLDAHLMLPNTDLSSIECFKQQLITMQCGIWCNSDIIRVKKTLYLFGKVLQGA